jgi:hypothetical protein
MQPSMLSNLGVMLGRRFEQTGSMDDLNRAVDIVSSVIDATSQNHSDQAVLFVMTLTVTTSTTRLASPPRANHMASDTVD